MLYRFGAFVTGITACYKYIQRIKTLEMTELGLRGTHAMCLFYLHHNPQGLTAAQLCQLCDEDKGAISRTLSELETKGYLHTRAAKKYRAEIMLTPEGTALAEKMDALIESWVGIGGDGLTEEQRSSFYQTLERIAANLKEKYEMEES